ncbi:efflux RND transporter periplasmic adaptor subunit [Tundrisphaera lichenicola]|uniref:efflux RND transporter periplasmic adaptor subunit n=1 Tax=Tundrisphaera lichenicola TaxID=2029860 RepID=UPI003EBE9436
MASPLLPERPEPAATLSRWQKIRLVVKVVELRLRFIVLMVGTGLVFGYWDTIKNHYEKWSRPPGDRHVAAHDFEYYCPMHPTVIQAEAGHCPICGMPLSKRKKGEKETLSPGVTARINLSPLRISQAGLRTSEVSYRPLAETVTTVGSVTIDERRLARISSKTKGMSRVEKLFVNFTGTPVREGEPLAELYSPELYQAIQEALLAQKYAGQTSKLQTSIGRTALGDPGGLLRSSKEKLSLWGIGEAQIEEILAKGQSDFKLPILSPIGGVIVRKNVVEGQYVSEGEAMFEVADLGHVWIQAQIYEDQIALVRVGQKVEATVEAYPGRVFPGTVAFKDPILNPATRTLNVRYDLENQDGQLQPGMFATVTLKTPIAETPEFQGRLATTLPGRGLARKVSLTVAEQEKCLVTNAKLGSMGDPVPVDVEGKHLWMCCSSCESKLRGHPAKFLSRLDPAPIDSVLSVSETSVIDTGTKKIVFVEAEPGVFEGREVVLGSPSGNLYPVLEGLAPGEKVAEAGAFLLDAETRLNAGAAPAAPEPQATPSAPTRAAKSGPMAAHVH